MDDAIFIVGKVTNYWANAWEFIGAFDNRDDAVRACISEWHFVGEAQRNVALPDEPVPWPSASYPMREP